jgi:hypothetical protein
MQLFASGAERLWQGCFHGQDVASGEAGDGEREETLPIPRSRAAGAVPQDRFTTVAGVAPLSPGPIIPGDGASDPAEVPPATDLELAPLGWTSAGQPFLSGSPGAGPVPAGAIPHLAAQIAGSLHQLPGGAVEIALSPDELGNLKLKLQADPQDPERMIVQLVFDRPETMDLFRRHGDQLADAIRAAGYADARLDFGQSGTGPDGGAGQGLTDGRKDGSGAPVPSESERRPGRPMPDQPFPVRRAESAGLDLRL